MSKLTIAVAVLLAALTVTALPALAETLSKDRISREIIGKTLTTSRRGVPVRLHYNTDGTVQMKAFVVSGSGTWKYSDDGICMNMTNGPKKGESCVTFEHLGANRYRNSEGMILTAK